MFDKSFLVVQIPCTSDHSLKIGIIVNWTRDVAVVLFELFTSYDMVRRIIVPVVVMLLKSWQKFLKYLTLSSLAWFDIRVEFSIISSFDVVNIKISISIFIHALKGLAHESTTEFVHWSSNFSKELIIFNQSVSIAIKQIEKSLNLSLVKTKHEVSHSFWEFVFVKG